MRIQKETSLIIDEFEINDEQKKNLTGVLCLTDEHDSSDMIYISIGTTQIGFVSKESLIEVALKILKLWNRRNLNDF